MKIFRVETPDGIGPFKGAGKLFNFLEFYAYNKMLNTYAGNELTHPNPTLNMIGVDKVIGCRSLESLSRWFLPEMLNILKRYDFKVNVYNIKQVIKNNEDSTQVAFIRKNAILIETLPLESLFK